MPVTESAASASELASPHSPLPREESPHTTTTLAVLYRIEGQDNQRLVRTQWPSASITPDELRDICSQDGVDMRSWRLRIYDEHFKGWLVPDAPMPLAAFRVVAPSMTVSSTARAVDVLLEPAGPAATMASGLTATPPGHGCGGWGSSCGPSPVASAMYSTPAGGAPTWQQAAMQRSTG